ncbi:MAG: hypothetical protein ACYCV0_18790 [Desulfitobacteriaceae bacterium]
MAMREGASSGISPGVSARVGTGITKGVWYFPEFVEKHKKPGRVKVAGLHTLIALIRYK